MDEEFGIEEGEQGFAPEGMDGDGFGATEFDGIEGIDPHSMKALQEMVAEQKEVMQKTFAGHPASGLWDMYLNGDFHKI